MSMMVCQRCGKEMVRRSSSQKYCPHCSDKTKKEYYQKRRQTPEYREYQRKYSQTPKRVERRRKYQQTPECKERERKCKNSMQNSRDFFQSIALAGEIAKQA